jgi:hypothetical protein
MGNVLSACCKGAFTPSRIISLTDFAAGRPKDSLYEPALADSEREAVADLLQYLENVSPGDKKLDH